MRKIAEGGAIGTAQAKAYTRPLIDIVRLGGLGFMIYDLWGGGSGLLSSALHFESKVWTAVFLILAEGMVPGFGASAASVAYTRYTGVTYVDDRLGFARAGGTDIAFWSGFLCLLGMLVVSHHYEVAALPSFVRALLVLFGAVAATALAASLVSRLLFRAMFGPPVPGPFWKG